MTGAPGARPPRPAPRLVVAGVVLTALCVAPHALDAQTVRGIIHDDAAGAAVGVAMVVLRHVDGSRAAMTLSTEAGHYVIRAPGEGRYTVGVERIGFRAHMTDPFELTAGEDLWLPIILRTEAVRLDGIVVVGGESRCRLPREEGALLADLWEEARKSLELAVWDDAERGAHVRIRSYERVLDVVTGEVREERYRTRTGMTRDPFFARPAGTLVRDGFIVPDSEGFTYYGLSAETILSDEFQDAHCFRARRPGRGQPATEVGLAFEPAPGRSQPGVAGVLWLDRETSELKRLEYRYTRHLLPVAVPLEPFGGRTDFRRLANGAVVIEGWWIRMPRFERTVQSDELPVETATALAARATERERLRQYRRAGLTTHEAGATAVSIALPGTATPAASPAAGTAVVLGAIHDSLTGGPLAGAAVYLVDAGIGTVTDPAGRFVLDPIPPGDWSVAFDHPSLDALGVSPAALAVVLAAGDTVGLHLATPSAATILGARCPAGEDWVVGFVRDRDHGAPVAGATVMAEWDERWRREGDRWFSAERVRRVAVTDAAGAYAICDVRPGSRVRVQAEPEDGRPVRREVEVRAGDGGRADFVVDPTARPPRPPVAVRRVAPAAGDRDQVGRVLGRVLSAETDEPLGGVQVRIAPAGDTRLTDDSGRFLFLRVPAGAAHLTAERLGYGAAEGEIDVPGGETLTVDVRMSVDPIAMDPLRVTARARLGRLTAFQDRAGRGFGSFILRDEIERRMPAQLSDLVSEHRLSVDGTRPYDTRLVNRRHNCGPMVYLDGAPLTRIADRRSAAAMAEAGEALNLVHPNDVEGIEIYLGPANLPAEFAGAAGGCGAVAIWTR